jgi:hypothetical protein
MTPLRSSSELPEISLAFSRPRRSSPPSYGSPEWKSEILDILDAAIEIASIPRDDGICRKSQSSKQ